MATQGRIRIRTALLAALVVAALPTLASSCRKQGTGASPAPPANRLTHTAVPTVRFTPMPDPPTPTVPPGQPTPPPDLPR